MAISQFFTKVRAYTDKKAGQVDNHTILRLRLNLYGTIIKNNTFNLQQQQHQ